MKNLLIVIFLILTSGVMAQTDNPIYDKLLADSLGADDYGMKSYVFVILKSGPVTIEDKEKVGKLFRGHLDNISRLAEEGKLIVAGPFGANDKSYRGLFILNVTTFEEANELLKTDPAVNEQLLEAELYNWYGPAALPEYLKVQKKISKENP